jgi:hypothetical protein
MTPPRLVESIEDLDGHTLHSGVSPHAGIVGSAGTSGRSGPAPATRGPAYRDLVSAPGAQRTTRCQRPA